MTSCLTYWPLWGVICIPRRQQGDAITPSTPAELCPTIKTSKCSSCVARQGRSLPCKISMFNFVNICAIVIVYTYADVHTHVRAQIAKIQRRFYRGYSPFAKMDCSEVKGVKPRLTCGSRWTRSRSILMEWPSTAISIFHSLDDA